MKKILAVFILVFSLIGLGLSFFSLNIARNSKPPKPFGHLAEIIPMQAGDFAGEDIPLGNTEEVARSAEKILQVNEYMNRVYTDGAGNEFVIYISYWAEGKESVARASAHTPDRCWVEVGWENLDEKKKQAEVFAVNGKDLMPAYYREMIFDTQSGVNVKRNIWFWFVLDGKRYDYGATDNRMPSIAKYLENIVRDAFINSPECYFVRIDSACDLRELAKSEGFNEILDSLGELILYGKAENES